MKEQDINNIIDMLDGMTDKDISRMKIQSSDKLEEGKVEEVYHHGRCDVGSPFARGCDYDILPDKK